MRCFVAIELSTEIRSQLAGLQRDLATADAGIRWVKPEHLHVTIKFLGEVADGAIRSVCQAIGEAARLCKPFDLRVAGAGCFPRQGRDVRVVWAGLTEPSGELQRSHEWLEAALEPLGFPPESRPLSSHVTLGRAKSPRKAAGLRARLARLADFDAGAQSVGEMVFFESRLRKTGPEYTVLVRERLGY